MSESRKGSAHQLQVGDSVLIRQAKRNKLTPRYSPDSMTVVEIKGSSVIASDGRKTIMRDGSCFKKLNQEETDEEEDVEERIRNEIVEEAEEEEVQQPAEIEAPDAEERGATSTTTPVVQQEVVPRRSCRDRVPKHLQDFVLG